MTLGLDFERVGHLLWGVSAQPQLGSSGELAVPGSQQVIIVLCKKKEGFLHHRPPVGHIFSQ